MKTVRIGLLGLGTVGGGTLQTLRRNAEEISRRAGSRIEITQAAVRDLHKPRALDLAGLSLTDDVTAVVNNPEVDIVLELIGGDQVAKACVLQAINNGKHVVTANKALIALHGNAIFAAAQAQGVIVAFESAVAGGIPIIKSIREGLAANRIDRLAGIINGTCNYILAAMQADGADFATALAQAQELGYAEADPAFDIDGLDAAHKLTILASVAFGIPLQFDKVSIEGITGITPEDLEFCHDLGYRIKHLGIAKRVAGGIELRVHPTLVQADQMLASVDGVMNAVLVHADPVGSMLYYGAGAGAQPTASAVVADLIDVARAHTTDPTNRVPHLAFQSAALTDLAVVAPADIETAYYLKLNAVNRPGVLAAITAILGDNGISIDSIIQKSQSRQAALDDAVKIVIVTHTTIEHRMEQARTALSALPTISGEITVIRLESLL